MPADTLYVSNCSCGNQFQVLASVLTAKALRVPPRDRKCPDCKNLVPFVAQPVSS
jgi:hypothetical protein